MPTDVHETILRNVIEDTGNSDNFVDRPVLQKEDPSIFGSGVKGPSHCGFTPEQVLAAFDDDMRAWVETGNRPSPPQP